MGSNNASSERHALKLLHLATTDALWTELFAIWDERLPPADKKRLYAGVAHVRALFGGAIPGIRRSNTPYHDLEHTALVSLTMARLLDGALLLGVSIASEEALAGLLAALFHDTGYLQDASEVGGTGAQHTHDHETRSVARLAEFAIAMQLSPRVVTLCREAIAHTSLQSRSSTSDEELQPDETEAAELLPMHLMFADIMGQMADRAYLEKILLLFQEFAEAGIDTYKNEFELLKQTPSFYLSLVQKHRPEFERASALLRAHFKGRSGNDVDPYQLYIERNLEYLVKQIIPHPEDYRSRLRRDGIVTSLDAA
jgi:hypothetical protein